MRLSYENILYAYNSYMQQTLITQQDSNELNSSSTQKQVLTTFQECLKFSQGRGLYNKKLFYLLAAQITFASLFLALPFFLFKKPIYCQNLQSNICCEQGDQQCVDNICNVYKFQILNHVQKQESLTYLFQLFCNKDWIRVVYKVCLGLFQILPETLSIIGFLVYGKLADYKGRKVSLKISWRMYVVGILMFSSAQSHLLKMLGYVLACINCFPTLILQFVLYFQHNIKKQKNRSSLLLLACLSLGPLFLSFLGPFITQINNRIILSVTCALPAFILAFLDNKIYESAIYLYKQDKSKSFGILNLIAKQNGKLPVFIDLSKSYWRKYVYRSTGVIGLLKNREIGGKMVIGFFFVFLVTFNTRLSQISLDQYTQTEYRSILVNAPTALADISLCLFLLKFKSRSCRIMNILIILMLLSLLACHELHLSEQTMKPLTISHTIAIRYLSQLCDGLLLIWSIQNFPTICRSFCVCFVFCGYGLGVFAAYLFRENVQIGYVIGLCLATVAIVFEGSLEFWKFGVMKDTLEGGYYDQNDIFCKN